MIRLIHAELIKFRTVSLWWLFALATLVSTAVTLTINIVSARSLLLPLAQYLQLQSHGHGDTLDAGFRDHLTSDWQLGHDVVTQAATVYTSGQLIGVLLACLIGIVLVTSEFYQSTATTTFLLTPRRTPVVLAKLITAVALAAASWLISTLVSLVAGGVFLHLHGYGLQLGQGTVIRAILLNGAAYLIWALFGVGLGALIRSQLGATVTATVLYLAGAAGAGVLFDLLNTYVIKSSWILTAQVIVPSIASAVMVSPTKTFSESPAQWVGAAVLIGYGVVFGLLGLRFLRRRDIA
jgi:ABC-type transport system involved in multi-copper enzyme maturation permease subunit